MLPTNHIVGESVIELDHYVIDCSGADSEFERDKHNFVFQHIKADVIFITRCEGNKVNIAVNKEAIVPLELIVI